MVPATALADGHGEDSIGIKLPVYGLLWQVHRIDNAPNTGTRTHEGTTCCGTVFGRATSGAATFGRATFGRVHFVPAKQWPALPHLSRLT